MARASEKERRRERIAEAWRRLREQEAAFSPPARPSEFGLTTLTEMIKNEQVSEVILYGRTSSRGQRLNHQLQGARRLIESMGVKVRRSFRDKNKKGTDLDRPGLAKALDAARRRNIPLVAAGISRFVRAADYHAWKSPNEMPTVEEFARFMELAVGVRLATLNDPDADPPSDEAFIRELFSAVKCRPVGRPPKQNRKARKEQCQPIVKWMRRDGRTYGEIRNILFMEYGIRPVPCKRTLLLWANEA